MIFKLIAACFAVFGFLCFATLKKPELYNEAVNLGGYSISGVVIISVLLFGGIWRMGKS